MNKMTEIFGVIVFVVFIAIPLTIWWFVTYPFHRMSFNKYMFGETI